MQPEFRRSARFLLLLCALFLATPGGAHARQATIQADGEDLRVFLMTVEPGSAIWEKFGHDALWIVDARTGQGLSYNYGIFDFDQPNFYLNFLRGRMIYSMGEYGPLPIDYEVAAYSAENRTIIAQELNLQPEQKAALREFLQWNSLPENSSYPYDYFRDNCATRIRDAIDRATGGQLRASLSTTPTDRTYRWHTRRMLADVELAYAGVELGMGNTVDAPLSAWEDSFLPTQLMEHLRDVQVQSADGSMAPLVLDERVVFQSTRPAPPATPPDRTVLYTVIGLLVGAALFLLGVAASRGQRLARFGFTTLGFLWSLTVGVFGVVIAMLWAFTHHTSTYWNENVLQANAFSLALAIVLLLSRSARWRRIALRIAVIVAALSALGFLIQVLPGFDQVNGEIIGLLLPAHMGLLAGLLAVERTVSSHPVDTTRGKGRGNA